MLFCLYQLRIVHALGYFSMFSVREDSPQKYQDFQNRGESPQKYWRHGHTGTQYQKQTKGFSKTPINWPFIIKSTKTTISAKISVIFNFVLKIMHKLQIIIVQLVKVSMTIKRCVNVISRSSHRRCSIKKGLLEIS